MSSSGGVLSIDRQTRDETAFEKFRAEHFLLIASLFLVALSSVMFYMRQDLPGFSQWWDETLIVGLVLFALSFFLDPLIALWTRWSTVAADSGLQRRRGGVPARYLPFPAGGRAVGLITSADTILPDEWDRSGPKLAQGFGYERVTIKQTRVFFRYFMCLTFSNKPSPVNQTCSKPISLKGQAVHVGIDEDGEDYYLDTAGHSGMIVAGLPGSGKTVFLRRLAKTFALNPANHIVVFDGKGTRDFEDLAAENLTVFSGTPDTNEEINAQFSHLVEELKARARSSVIPGRVIVIVDECQGFTPVKGLTSAEKQAREKSLNALRDFVARGRSLGFFTILATQKPDSDTIPTALRDNCALRACGRLRTLEAEKMVLGESLGRAQHLEVGQMIFDDAKAETHLLIKVAQIPKDTR